MKGLVVVICAPSQRGKDFIATKTMEELSLFDKNSSYASCCKTRKKRVTDGEHIICVKSKEEITIPQADRLEATIYGSQTIAYSKKEIRKKLADGEIVFIATGAPELAKKVKSEFGSQCFSVFVKGQQVNEKTMIKEDMKRYGDLSALTDEKKAKLEEDSKLRIANRLAVYEAMKPDYVDFIKDGKLGADYIFINLYTLIGGYWNREIDEMAKGKFAALTNAILDIHQMINNNQDWGNRYSLSEVERENITNKHNKDNEDNKGNEDILFTLQDVLLEYLDGKHSWEV